MSQNSPTSSSKAPQKRFGHGDGKWETVGTSKAKQPEPKRNGIPVLKNSKSKLPQSPRSKEVGKGSNGQMLSPFKAKKSSKAPPPDKNLSKVASEITGQEIKDVMDKSKSLFPQTPLVWCKDVVDFLNGKLDSAKVDNNNFQRTPTAFPLSELPKPAATALRGSLLSLSTDVLGVLLEHCLKTLGSLVSKGQSSYGYQMAIQLLAQNRPRLANAESFCSKFLDFIIANKNQHQMCVSILWALGQCGASDYRSGLEVWTEVMMPVLGIKSCTAVCVGYLEWIFEANNKELQYDVFNSKNYFLYLDGTFNSTANLSSSTEKRLQEMYPVVKAMAFGSQPEKDLHVLFPSFLSRLNKKNKPALRKEALNCLVECLSVDGKSFEAWTRLYSQFIPETGDLLAHINETRPRNISQSAIVALTKSFAKQSASMGLQSADASKVLSLSETMQSNSGSGRCCARLLWTFAFSSLILCTIVYLVLSYKPGGQIDAGLKYIGVDRSIMVKAQRQLLLASKQLEKELSVLSEKARPLVESTTVYFSQKFHTLADAIRPGWQAFQVEVVQPTVEFMSQKSSEAQQWISKQDIPGKVSKMFT